ncbi:MAG: sensor histidine kinase, partial [Phycisphaerae bacterium]
MRTTRTRSSVAAIATLVLMYALVIGGMTWVTRLQLDVARREALRLHDAKVREELMRLDGYMYELLTPELARESADYIDYYLEAVDNAFTPDGVPTKAKILRASPIIAAGPSYSWIDLYFHVSEEDKLMNSESEWESPQVPSDDQLADQGSARAAQTKEWLESRLSLAELAALVNEARDRREAFTSLNIKASSSKVQRIDQLAKSASRQDAHVFHKHWNRDLGTNRFEKCIVREHFPGSHGLNQNLLVCNPPMTLELTADPMAIFWIDGPPRQGNKMMFVRTGHEGETRFYQGFVADWEHLKPQLANLISEDVFPDAALLPHEDGDSPWADPLSMTVLPVRLAGDSIANPDFATARASVVQLLSVAWIVALAVLGVATVAVRNLIALTNRRLQFAYAVTHELRTPLTTFRLYADMLSAGLVPEESRQEYLDSLNTESIRLSNIVQGVLEYSRLENQKVRIKPCDTHAGALISNIHNLVKPRCDENGVVAVTRNELNEDDLLQTDIDLVNQIAGVLCDNAVRHARTSDDPAIELRLSGQNGSLSLHVTDSGDGVDRKDARHIFKPFRRGKSAEANAQRGIGLGLALAKSWAQLLGGKLELLYGKDPNMGGAHFC